MVRAWVAMMVAAATIGGCDSEEKQREIDQLRPRMEAAATEAMALRAALPAAGAEKAVACAGPPQVAVVITEASLARFLGDQDELDPVEQTVAARFDRDDQGLVSLARLESWKTNSDVVSGTVFIAGKQLAEYEQAPALVVIRTVETDIGKMSGKRIEENGRWKGWAFVLDKESKQLVGAASAEAESPNQVHTMKDKGRKVSERLLLERAAAQALPKLKKALPCVKWP